MILVSQCKKWWNDQNIRIETYLKTNYIIHYSGKMTDCEFSEIKNIMSISQSIVCDKNEF